MVDQTSVNNGKPEKTRSAASRFGHNVADLTHDLIALGELQFQLLSVDVRDARARGIGPIVSIAIVALIALSAFPVLMIGAALMIAGAAEISTGAALVGVAVAGLAVAGILGLVAWSKLKHAIALLTRSQNELRENIRSIKHALKGHREAPAPQSTARSER